LNFPATIEIFESRQEGGRIRTTVANFYKMPLPMEQAPKDIMSKLNSFYQFKDTSIQREFAQHFEQKKSMLIMLIFAFAYTFLILPYHVTTLLYNADIKEYYYSFVSLLLTLIGIVCCWTLFYAQLHVNRINDYSCIPWIRTLQAVMMFSIAGSLCLSALNGIFIQDCKNYPSIVRISALGWDGGCQKDITAELLAFFVIDPVVFVVSFCETRLLLVMLWIGSTGLVLVFVSIHYQSNCTLYLILWICCLLIFVIELHVQKVWVFHVHHEMKEALLENERKADETYAEELRHMIGNVAHDLKTVS